MRRVWYQRVIRFWLLVLLPIAIYCAYEAYKSHTLIGAFQSLADDWLETAQRHEREGTRGTFDARAEWRSASEGRNRNIDNRKFYIVSSALLLPLPLFVWVSAIALKWIWRGRLSEEANRKGSNDSET